ncbi:MAG: hypothetical protein V3W04_08200 [Gammaproteobacteria bacterium]
MIARISIITVLFYSLLMQGCASNPSAGEAAAKQAANSVLTTGRSVNKIVVSLDDSLELDRKEAATKYSLTERVKNDLQDVLQGKGVFDSSAEGITVNINVSAFRLRSGVTAMLAGVLAGADILAVNVEAESNGSQLKNFKTNTSTALGGFGMPAPSQRINRMSKALAKRIAKQL